VRSHLSALLDLIPEMDGTLVAADSSWGLLHERVTGWVRLPERQVWS
jgi:hypothetical protein